jgi:6-pyruvoyl-tetrahydropterin synthase
MIAHSFRGELFGPAQRLHGATYVVDVEFRREKLDASGVVVDIGRAGAALRSILSGFEYSNLDEQPPFQGKNTTTEYLSRFVFDRMAEKVAAGELGIGGDAVGSLRIVLHESHVAWASYEGQLSSGGKGTP